MTKYNNFICLPICGEVNLVKHKNKNAKAAYLNTRLSKE
jgi:hypothetical protein